MKIFVVVFGLLSLLISNFVFAQNKTPKVNAADGLNKRLKI